MAIFDISDENEEELIFKRRRVSSKEAASSRAQSWIVSDDKDEELITLQQSDSVLDYEGVFKAGAEVANNGGEIGVFKAVLTDSQVSGCLVSDANHVYKNMEEEVGEDRISALPDCLILEILSRLPKTKEAIKTSSLSKRWQYVWTFVPNLIFIHDAPYNDVYAPYSGVYAPLRIPYFFTSVDHTLAQCRKIKLNQFILDTRYETVIESRLRNWICHVINRSVQDMQLLLHSRHSCSIFDFRNLKSFFINSCFTNLKLACCIFHPTGAISWKNLTSLSISRGKLNEAVIRNILSGSPRLETFELVICYGFTRLDINSKSVKKLVLIDPSVRECIIDAPYITTLDLKNHFAFETKIVLLNVSSLIIAEQVSYKV